MMTQGQEQRVLMDPHDRRRLDWSAYRGTVMSIVVLLLLSTISYLLSSSSSLSLHQHATDLTYKIEQVMTEQDRTDSLRNLLVSELGSSDRRHFLQELFLHLSVAFAVAIIIILTVELYARQRTRREILEYRDSVAKEVWQAIFGRLVPATITKELDNILKSKVVQEDYNAKLTLKPPYKELGEDLLVLRREVRYELKNITNQTIEHPVRSFLIGEHEDKTVTDEKGNTFTLPGHRAFLIDGSEIGGGMASALKKDEKDRLRNLEHNVQLRAGQSVEVYICSEEQARLRDKNSYTTLTMIHGLTLLVINNCENRVELTPTKWNPRLNHPNVRDFVPGPDGICKYKGGLLPGQSYVVSWQPKK